MKAKCWARFLISFLVLLALAPLVVGLLHYWLGSTGEEAGNWKKEEAIFWIRAASAVGVVAAVVTALFGDTLRRILNMPELHIRELDRPDKMPNKHQGIDHYSHHLRVVNRKPHKPVKDCQVWLTGIEVRDDSGKWSDFGFAVNRLMSWAPADKTGAAQSFSDEWVFDLGHTYFKLPGRETEEFRLALSQEGNLEGKDRCPRGESRLYTFRIVAKNFVSPKNFVVQIEVKRENKPDWWIWSEWWTEVKVVP